MPAASTTIHPALQLNCHLLPAMPACLVGWVASQHFCLLFCSLPQPINAADPGKFEQTTAAPSRGALTTDFLTGSMTPLEYLQVRSNSSSSSITWNRRAAAAAAAAAAANEVIVADADQTALRYCVI
jgi:hypothetical protein